MRTSAPKPSFTWKGAQYSPRFGRVNTPYQAHAPGIFRLGAAIPNRAHRALARPAYRTAIKRFPAGTRSFAARQVSRSRDAPVARPAAVCCAGRRTAATQKNADDFRRRAHLSAGASPSSRQRKGDRQLRRRCGRACGGCARSRVVGFTLQRLGARGNAAFYVYSGRTREWSHARDCTVPSALPHRPAPPLGHTPHPHHLLSYPTNDDYHIDRPGARR
jgi:hypothetical protein